MTWCLFSWLMNQQCYVMTVNQCNANVTLCDLWPGWCGRLTLVWRRQTSDSGSWGVTCKARWTTAVSSWWPRSSGQLQHTKHTQIRPKYTETLSEVQQPVRWLQKEYISVLKEEHGVPLLGFKNQHHLLPAVIITSSRWSAFMSGIM